MSPGRATAGLVLAAALAACAAPPAGDRVSLRVAPRLSSFVAYLAADAGYFATEDLEVELLVWDSAATVIPSLAQGDLDVSTVWRLDPAYLNVIGRGGRIRLVAGGMRYAPGECGYSSFLVRPEVLAAGRLDELAGLRGLRITSERTSSSYYVWARLLERAGLGFDDVEIVDLPAEARIDAFASGRVDVTTATEPWQTQLVRSGHAVRWRPVADVLPGFQSSFVVFGRRLLDERRDLGVRFLRAWQRAVRDYVDHGRDERLISIVAARTRLDPGDLAAMCWPTYDRDGEVDRATLEDYQRWALAEGLIDAALPLETIFDASFLANAAAGGG
ncbi:MAG TPA: ABC transporter substrate-binding protein [Thermoanaerobaculia bacterium]